VVRKDLFDSDTFGSVTLKILLPMPDLSLLMVSDRDGPDLFQRRYSYFLEVATVSLGFDRVVLHLLLKEGLCHLLLHYR